jgi:lipopolysaccharide transport system ATP-binding protein
MGAIETLTQRAYVFEGGRIAFEGPTADAIQSYIKLNAQYAELQIDLLPRSGNGRLRLKRVYAIDEQDEPTSIVASGAPLSIVMEYDASAAANVNGDGRDCQNISFGLSLHDATGQTLAIHYTDYQGDPFATLPSTGSVVFRMNELPFKAGRYYIGARVIVNGMEADWPRGHVGYFDVETGDFYGTGRTFHSGIATHLLRGEWLIHEPGAAGRQTDTVSLSGSSL